MKRIALLVTSAMVLGLLVGCPFTRYTIEMVPRGIEIARSVKVERHGDGEPRHLRTTEGVFRDEFPDDTDGGRGRYYHLATSMGSLSGYLERTAGNDDQAAVIADQFKAADRIVDILIGWAKAERGQHPEFAKLRGWLDGEFRRDLKNLALHVWQLHMAGRQVDASTGETGNEPYEHAVWARAAAYLLERGYVRPDDAVRFSHDIDSAVEAVLRRIATEKIVLADKRLAEDIVAGLLALAKSEDPPDHSLIKYLRTTEEFQAKLAEWKRIKATQPDSQEAEPEPMDVLGELAGRVIGVELFGLTDDQANVTLKTGVEPFATNGLWDAKAGTVTWSVRFIQKGPPVVLYALWAQPDEAFQKARLGEAVLKGARLAEYCLWHKGLTEAQAKQWDDFLAGLKPGEDLADKLDDFRFAPPPTTGPDDEVVTGARLILNALGVK